MFFFFVLKILERCALMKVFAVSFRGILKAFEKRVVWKGVFV